jgi:hypothetical protein
MSQKSPRAIGSQRMELSEAHSAIVVLDFLKKTAADLKTDRETSKSLIITAGILEKAIIQQAINFVQDLSTQDTAPNSQLILPLEKTKE